MWSANHLLLYRWRFIISTHRHSLFYSTGIACGCLFYNRNPESRCFTGSGIRGSAPAKRHTFCGDRPGEKKYDKTTYFFMNASDIVSVSSQGRPPWEAPVLRGKRAGAGRPEGLLKRRPGAGRTPKAWSGWPGGERNQVLTGPYSRLKYSKRAKQSGQSGQMAGRGGAQAQRSGSMDC